LKKLEDKETEDRSWKTGKKKDFIQVNTSFFRFHIIYFSCFILLIQFLFCGTCLLSFFIKVRGCACLLIIAVPHDKSWGYSN